MIYKNRYRLSMKKSPDVDWNPPAVARVTQRARILPTLSDITDNLGSRICQKVNDK
jgi:hypothetical protein